MGPLLLGASFSMSSWINSAGDWALHAGLWRMMRVVTGVTPTVLLTLTFSFLYVAVPNRRVRYLDALSGGIAAGLAFALLRWAFGLYVADIRAYQSIYGAVAVVPIFLLWMYVSWVVVLFGAELAAALPEWRLQRPDLGAPLPARRRLALALTVLSVLLDEARHGGKGRSRRDLLDEAGEAERELLDVLDRLRHHGYLIETGSNRYVLGRDLAVVTLADMIRALDLGLGAGEADDCPAPWMRRIASRLAEAANAEAIALDLPLRAVLEDADSAGLRRLADAHDEVSGAGKM
jgi:membrane protein